eukprot:12928593-Prorocentrum_lima.AAC.1
MFKVISATHGSKVLLMTTGLNCSSREVQQSRVGNFSLVFKGSTSSRDPAPNDGAGRLGPQSNSPFPAEHCGVVTPGVKFKWPGRFEHAPDVDVLGGVHQSGIGGIYNPE